MLTTAKPVPWLDALAERVHRIPLIDVVAALSLFLVVMWGFERPLTRFTEQIALLVVLLRPDLMRSAALWAALSITSSIALIEDWSTADNHKYLLVYWLWVMTLATGVRSDEDGEAILNWHARFFVVFVFLVAAFQKLFSPTYMSGEMFELKLMLDERFKAFGHLFGYDKSLPDAAQMAILKLKSPLNEFENNAILLPATDTSRMLALLITWYDLLVQFAIGLLFLPARKITDRLGHLVLLFFIYTTYLPAPVFGFGWTLSIYGFVLARSRFSMMPLAYGGALIAVLAYQAPWREWVLAW